MTEPVDHKIEVSTGIACGRGPKGSFRVMRARCSCGDWQAVFTSTDEVTRARARESAKQHLEAARQPGLPL